MTKTVAWVVNRLDEVGGGQRLLLEGVKHYRSLGYRALIYTWFFDEVALFGGAYENVDIHVLTTTAEVPRTNILGRALSRAKTLSRLRESLLKNKVSDVFVQGEYDVALVYLARLWTGIRCRFLIFGQIFQYPHDNAKYSLAFRRHLQEIVESRPGYKETVPLRSPALSLKDRVANEAIAIVRWFAVRKADKRFTFSRQIQWETEMLFGCTTAIAAGAFPEQLLSLNDFNPKSLERYGLTQGKYILSLSRLDRKKRVDLIIEAFAKVDTDNILVIAGGGSDEAFLRECAVRCGAANRIKFIGLVSDEDMLPLKHYASLFISMDIGDFDISPLEAMATGTIAICPTDFDPDPRLMAIPGFVRVEPDASSLARVMKECLSSPPVFSRSDLAPWSWEAYFNTLIKD